MISNRISAIALLTIVTVACGRDRNPVQPDTIPDPPDSLPKDTTRDSIPTAPIVATMYLAANIAECGNTNADSMTAALITDTSATVLALGDNAFPNGTLANYNDCYQPTWGRFLARTYAAVGNHDYDSSATAEGFAAYFGARGGPAGKYYYSFNVGAWHVIVLNIVDSARVAYGPGSEQMTWLQADLAASASKRCVMAVWHNTWITSSADSAAFERTTIRPVVQRLFDAGVDVVVSGTQHWYERMQPMNAAGAVDSATGIRFFNSGLGGESRATPTAIHPNSAARGTDYGVLRLTLADSTYDWSFLPVAGSTFTDTGSGRCR